MSLMLRSSVTTADIFVGNNLFNSKYNFSSSEMNPATTALSKMINTCFAAASSSAFERFLNLLEMWEPYVFFHSTLLFPALNRRYPSRDRSYNVVELDFASGSFTSETKYFELMKLPSDLLLPIRAKRQGLFFLNSFITELFYGSNKTLRSFFLSNLVTAKVDIFPDGF